MISVSTVVLSFCVRTPRALQFCRFSRLSVSGRAVAAARTTIIRAMNALKIMAIWRVYVDEVKNKMRKVECIQVGFIGDDKALSAGVGVYDKLSIWIGSMPSLNRCIGVPMFV